MPPRRCPSLAAPRGCAWVGGLVRPAQGRVRAFAEPPKGALRDDARASTLRRMAARMLPPFRADHVGSLLRPPALLDARARHRAGELDDAGLREAEDAAIRDVVALQREAGVRTATDGEFRRTSWHMDFIYQLEGVDPTDQKLAVHFRNKGGRPRLRDRGTERPRPGGAGAHDLRRRLRVPVGSDGRRPGAEADHPLAEHGPLPRRPGGDRRVGLRRARAVLGGPHRGVRRGGPPAGGARLHLPPARRHQPRLPQRPRAARDGRGAGRGPRAPARAVRRERQRRDRRPPGGHAGHHAHVPRQLPLVVGGRGWLRLRGRGALLPARRRRLLPRVRRRAVRRLRAAAVRPRGQAGRARPGHHQDRRSSRTRTS